MIVWKSDEKLLIFASLISPSKIILFEKLYYYMRNYCNLIGLEQWYFSLITYMWKLQTFCG